MDHPEPAYRDNCPECLEGPNDPTGTCLEGGSLVADYMCTACDHTWQCWWNVAALPSDGASAGDAA